MARFSVPNLRNYSSHLSRGVLLFIGALVIIGLVAATYFYGEQARDNVAEQNNEQITEETETPFGPAPTEQAEESEADNNDNGDDVTERDRDNDDVAAIEGAPDELADTGPGLYYGLITLALVTLAVFYRHSTQRLESVLRSR